MSGGIFSRIRGIAAALFLFVVFIAILRRAEVAIECLRGAISLCVTNVIPALFPFMVISELFIESSAGNTLASALSAPMKLLFGLSGEGGGCFLLGSICGFPIGTRSAVSLYDKGRLSRHEVVRIMSFSNNPGSAFVISAVGISLYGSRQVGVILYVCVLLSAVTIGAVSRLFFRDCSGEKEKKRVLPLSETRQRGAMGILCSAISSSFLSVLTVCAYVLFFSALVGCLASYLSVLELPIFSEAILFGIFEISSGAARAALVEPRLLSLCLCAFSLGFSGLSVHFQLMALCEGRNIPYPPLLLSKLCQGALSAFFMLLAARFFFPEIRRSVTEASYAPAYDGHILLIVSVCALVLLLIFSSSGRKKKIGAKLYEKK